MGVLASEIRKTLTFLLLFVSCKFLNAFVVIDLVVYLWLLKLGLDRVLRIYYIGYSHQDVHHVVHKDVILDVLMQEFKAVIHEPPVFLHKLGLLGGLGLEEVLQGMHQVDSLDMLHSEHSELDYGHRSKLLSLLLFGVSVGDHVLKLSPSFL